MIGQSIEPHTVIVPDFCDKITVYVSDGTLSEGDNKLYLIMPDLKFKSIGEAQEAMREIASYGISIKYELMWESYPAGTVYYQSIEPGATVLINHSKPIKIFYSDGNKPAQNTEPETPVTDENVQASEESE